MKQNKRSRILMAANIILCSMVRRKLCAYLHMAVFCLGKVLEDDTTRCTTSTGEVQPRPEHEGLSYNTGFNPERKESPAGSKESGSVYVPAKAQTNTNQGFIQQRKEQGDYPVSIRRGRVKQVPNFVGVEDV